MIKFLIEKEFKQLLRNSFLPKLILVFPCMIMLLMPWAVNMEIKNIRLNTVIACAHSGILLIGVNSPLINIRINMKKNITNIDCCIVAE